MKRKLLKIVPDALKPALRKNYFIAADLLFRWKNPDTMVPPPSMRFVGSGNFEAIGAEFQRYFIELAGLRPTDHVLDVGCGIGRMAIPLTRYLIEDAEYHGIDIVEKGIDWCRKRISPKFSNFHFQHSNVFNRYYNPGGDVPARRYRFPFEDDRFDFVFLTSVFTHMLPPDMENYLGEVSRVLKNGGRCLITFFLLNDDALARIRAGQSTLDFRHEQDGCRVVDRAVPEDAVAYSEETVRNLFEACSLDIDPPIHYGSWCGRSDYLSYQDLIVATKRSADFF